MALLMLLSLGLTFCASIASGCQLDDCVFQSGLNFMKLAWQVVEISDEFELQFPELSRAIKVLSGVKPREHFYMVDVFSCADF